MKCIFCDLENKGNSAEHIVPESFGNKDYLLQKGDVCDECNGRFSKFEEKALTNSVFIMERARFGVATKKGKNAKGHIKELRVAGDKDFRPTFLTLAGLDKADIQDLDPITGTFRLVVSSFDKSEVAASKLLLKIGLESIFKSQKELYKKYDFTHLKNYLITKTNDDWPFISSDIEAGKFLSVPKMYDKYLLQRRHCSLKYCELDSGIFLFKFKYGAIPMIINLTNRTLDWIPSFLTKDSKAIYPEHFRKKLKVTIPVD